MDDAAKAREISILRALRDAGWRVAVHNDYNLQGRFMTFWLLTHGETQRYVIGEGESDYIALLMCRSNAADIVKKDAAALTAARRAGAEAMRESAACTAKVVATISIGHDRAEKYANMIRALPLPGDGGNDGK